MKEAEMKIEGEVNRLLGVLDRDIQYLEQSVSCLNELRSLTIKHDNKALSELLERIQSESDNFKNHELKRQSIRKELAVALHCNIREMTLSRLEANLPGQQQADVTIRKTRLKELVKKLKQEYISTTFLLAECARFNSLLLKSVLGIGKPGTITYTGNGTAKRHTDTKLVNMQF